jgi:hypothetical protein
MKRGEPGTAATGSAPESKEERDMSVVEPGIDPTVLPEDDLLRELERLHATRTETLRHGSDDALARHTSRTAELEREYLRRHPHREVDPNRLREGARLRADQA